MANVELIMASVANTELRVVNSPNLWLNVANV